MSDIVERLRNVTDIDYSTSQDIEEAAREIETLRKERDELRAENEKLKTPVNAAAPYSAQQWKKNPNYPATTDEVLHLLSCYWADVTDECPDDAVFAMWERQSRPVIDKITSAISAAERERDELRARLESVDDLVGMWLSAALDDPKVCDEFKNDIHMFMRIMEESRTPDALKCTDCGGDGYFKGPRLGDEPCPACNGSGKPNQETRT